ncbi:MAG: Abortive infection protein, partial [Frankiales bacterium]|nr:Abortive infection protein [Frankiales bacterium]
SETGLPRGLAITLAVVGLLLSFGLSRVAQHLADPTDVIDQALRKALALTLLFYVVLGVALAVFCIRGRVGLVWVRGSAVEALMLGLPLGLVGGGLAVALNSAVSGQLTSDPNVELLVGGGGALRILLTLIVTSALAPLVEETLFRGVLAGTLLGDSTRAALWWSAIAFGVWHMNLVSLRYYVLMGLLLCWLWLKRGLVASMAAHAAFNGVLTLAAVVATGGSGHVTHVGALSFSLPGGWHTTTTADPEHRLLASGPAGAGIDVSYFPVRAGVTTSALLKGLAVGETAIPFVRVVPGSEHEIAIPGGEAVTADLLIEGQPGHICQVLSGGSIYQLLMVTAGSPSAERQWRVVLSSTRVQ